MILHECSCFIEFIKRVGERDKMYVEHLISLNSKQIFTI